MLSTHHRRRPHNLAWSRKKQLCLRAIAKNAAGIHAYWLKTSLIFTAFKVNMSLKPAHSDLFLKALMPASELHTAQAVATVLRDRSKSHILIIVRLPCARLSFLLHFLAIGRHTHKQPHASHTYTAAMLLHHVCQCMSSYSDLAVS